jgi:hypothetical protein
MKFHAQVQAYIPRKPTRGPFLTSPLAPRGEICPLGGMFTPLFTPRGEHSLLFRRMEGQTENFTPGDNFTPGGQLRSWGSKFAPRGEVKIGPLNVFSHHQVNSFLVHWSTGTGSMTSSSLTTWSSSRTWQGDQMRRRTGKNGNQLSLLSNLIY